MKLLFRFSSAVPLLLAASTVLAHPGHVHVSGPVHGTSWLDLAGFLLASTLLPAAALLVARWRNRRR